MNPMRAVVFAYHNMGIVGLSALLRNGFEIPMVFSHADDPSENRWFGSVPDFCRERGIPVHLVEKVNEAPWPAKVREAKPDYLFSFYYRSMLKEEILSAPRLAALNLHGSLLPKFRGRAPVNWVLVKGETETGVTLHVMEIKPDAGDIVGQAAVPIAFEDTALSLFGKMEKAAGALLDDLLPKLAKGDIPRRRNLVEEGSYFGGRKPADGRIDWSAPALEIYNLVRAVTRPYPGAFAMMGGSPLLVWHATPLPAGPASGAPGTIVPLPDGTVGVSTGAGLLRLDEIEWNGKTATGAAAAGLLVDGRLT
ncbi:MAG TPA: formyltransferase [Candidatus Deferrimicrobiaceae bacterium]|jgi:UDP-4-amino-4-deoxy-L-arabinose formyltransferase/UDP-glucuronic acid dehydrogenase (UDP-4-keto-hexauronic acid decarboxylating)